MNIPLELVTKNIDKLKENFILNLVIETLGQPITKIEKNNIYCRNTILEIKTSKEYNIYALEITLTNPVVKKYYFRSSINFYTERRLSDDIDSTISKIKRDICPIIL